MDKTVLSFKDQVVGAQGILIKSSHGITLEDFTVEDSKGDAIKLQDCEGVTRRGLNTRWTGGAQETNGGYGLYPVSCTNVLMENCEASYASDAGIYVGQSTNVIVRNNYVHHNVAGLEIENTRNADVYDNTVTGNTGGLLIFDMPDLPQANGYKVRVHDNTVEDNNFQNFAAPGTVVSTLPPGTGMLVMAHREVEIFDNVIRKHKTTALSITSWIFTGKPFESAEYDPFSSALYIHDNTISETQGPSDTSTEFGQVLTALTQGQGVDIAIDGIFNPATVGENGLPAGEASICLRNNGEVSFLNINAAKGRSPEEWAQVMNNDIFTPIGPKARHLNKDYSYEDGTANQLDKWAAVGYLSGYDPATGSEKLPQWDAPDSGALHDRAMAYLDINCGHCHNPHGPAHTSGLNLTAHQEMNINLGIGKAPVSAGKGSGGRDYSIVPSQPDESILVYRMESTDPGAMMPEIGRVLVHEEGVKLIREWIEQMTND